MNGLLQNFRHTSYHSRQYKIFWFARFGRLDLLLNDFVVPPFGGQQNDLEVALQGAASGGQVDLFVELECWWLDAFGAGCLDYQNLIERTITNNHETLFLHLIKSVPPKSMDCCAIMHHILEVRRPYFLKHFSTVCGHHRTRQELKDRIYSLPKRSAGLKQYCLEMLFAKELEKPPLEWQAAMEMRRLRQCAYECADFIFRTGGE